MRRSLFLLCLLTALLAVFPARADDDDADPRSFMHGIAAVPDGKGGDWVFFSSSGLPPQGELPDESWTHDVYAGDWHGGDARLKPELFIHRPEAQEPVSAAETADGHIMLSFEDGWDTEDEVDQRYGVYGQNLAPIRPYPQEVSPGGHSGHAAAGQNLFIVAYSSGWIDGGGVDDLGSGYGVYARIYDSSGRPQNHLSLAFHKREWWPLVAASPRHALIVWQVFIPGRVYVGLKMAVVDLPTGRILARRTFPEQVAYYTYAVRYIDATGRFLVAGTRPGGHGFAYLIDEDGQVAAHLGCMPPIMREAGIAALADDAYLPAEGKRLIQLKMTPSSLIFSGIAPAPLDWSTTGTLGLPDGAGWIRWFSLDKSGLQEGDFDVKTLTAPASREKCH